MRILDLFCGQGGCSVGYAQAGFAEVVGVDSAPQSRYPFEFYKGDALEFAAKYGRGFDAVHASPPCQAYSLAAFSRDGKGRDNRKNHPDLLAPTRAVLKALGRPWAIENVECAPVDRSAAVKLCGLMFDLKVFRHRWFELSFPVLDPIPHPSHKGYYIGKNGFCCVCGHGGGVSKRMRLQIEQFARYGRFKSGAGGTQPKAEWERAMGIDWMTRDGLAQAIPPAYTRYVGGLLIDEIRYARKWAARAGRVLHNSTPLVGSL